MPSSSCRKNAYTSSPSSRNGCEASRPAGEVSVVVGLPTQAQVEGIADPAQVRLIGAIDVGGDERHPMRGQAAEDLVVSPARVGELERETDRPRPGVQEPSERSVVALDGRGDRQQDQAESLAEGLDRAGQPETDGTGSSPRNAPQEAPRWAFGQKRKCSGVAATQAATAAGEGRR